MAKVTGRGIRRGDVQFLYSTGTLVIRVDDDEDDELWVEVQISETELLSVLAKLHRISHDGQDVRKHRTAPFDGSY